MKNSAYKRYLVFMSTGRDLSIELMFELMDHNQMAFEIMEEAEAEYNMRGYEKAAAMVRDQVNKMQINK